MKLYKVMFTGTYVELKEIPQIEELSFIWEKDYSHPDNKYGEKYEEDNKILKEEWENLTVEDIITRWKGTKGVSLTSGSREQLITAPQLDNCFHICTIKQIIEVAAKAQVQAIDINKLANSISNMLLGEVKEKLFNQKLEIHQPNMPLFTYNDFKSVSDFCTESLQNEINDGYRVVAVLPQPDQRRPDYILGKYIKDIDES